MGADEASREQYPSLKKFPEAKLQMNYLFDILVMDISCRKAAKRRPSKKVREASVIWVRVVGLSKNSSMNEGGGTVIFRGGTPVVETAQATSRYQAVPNSTKQY